MAHQVTLNWTDSVDTGSSYKVYRSLTSGLYSGTLTPTPLVPGTTSYIDNSVTAGTYFYVVTAILNGAESVHSNEASTVILPAPPTSLTTTGT